MYCAEVLHSLITFALQSDLWVTELSCIGPEVSDLSGLEMPVSV